MTTDVERLVGRRAEYEAAAKALASATQDAYPDGTRLYVTLGNARVYGEVESSGGCWWSRPDYMTIRNIRTGKRRAFCATLDTHDIVIVSKPPNAVVKGPAAPAGSNDETR